MRSSCSDTKVSASTMASETVVNTVLTVSMTFLSGSIRGSSRDRRAALRSSRTVTLGAYSTPARGHPLATVTSSMTGPSPPPNTTVSLRTDDPSPIASERAPLPTTRRSMRSSIPTTNTVEYAALRFSRKPTVCTLLDSSTRIVSTTRLLDSSTPRVSSVRLPLPSSIRNPGDSGSSVTPPCGFRREISTISSHILPAISGTGSVMPMRSRPNAQIRVSTS